MGKRQGFEGEAFIGTAGTTAATRLVNSRDLTYGIETEKGETTVRGNSNVPPIHSEAVTKRTLTGTIQMVLDDSDTALETMRTAVALGTPIALRLKDYSTGKGFDGDVNLSVSSPMPLAGEQVLEFSWTVNNSLREAQPYV